MIDQALLRRVFDYDDKRGVLVYKHNRSSMARKGDVCGCISRNDWRSRFGGKSHLVHRLIWIWHNGPITKSLVIDHLDGDAFNNRISNLMLTTHVGNGRNMRLRKNNTSGVQGVVYSLRERKWVAYIHIHYRKRHLGYFGAKEEAIAARKSAEITYGFSGRHGEIRKNAPQLKAEARNRLLTAG